MTRLMICQILFLGATLCCPEFLPAEDPKTPVILTDPVAAADDPDFQMQGEYTASGKGLQIIALGQGEFEAVLYNGGLPGAGWDQKSPQRVEGFLEEMQDLIESYKKVQRASPTLGAAPPEGSVVLFDGRRETFEKQWQKGARYQAGKTDDTGLLREGAVSVEKFQDYSLHLEFLLPFMPESRGQGRGNSGLYQQGRYETQILDSFGLEGKDNECGGLYKIKAPDLNMCLPPLAWQTYDVEMISARFDEKGKKIQNARLTVRLNGVLIHNNVDLPGVTGGNRLPESPEPGPIFLQNHKDPVQFRNIWVLPRDAESYSRRPLIPGFERFHAQSSDELRAGGELLLGELNCVGCHAPSGDQVERIVRRSGPKLEGVGQRIHADYLRKYILEPHAHKPGTTMPTLLAGMTTEERQKALEPIVHFLAATGKVPDQVVDQQAVNRGKKLFATIGCAICHGEQTKEAQAAPLTTSVPLGPLAKKYSLSALIQFLQNPHAIRPDGRMPSLHLSDQEANDLGHYLLRDAQPISSSPNVHFQFYSGKWRTLPNFAKMKPAATGVTSAFNLLVVGQTDNFGMVFEGWCTLPQEGVYRFYLGSDDGSRLRIDQQELIVNDGVHPHTIKSGEKKLSAGPHHIQIEYFEQSGGESLSLEVEGPQLTRQNMAPLLRLEKEESSGESTTENLDRFVLNRDLIEQGKTQFAAVGCAACHQISMQNQTLTSTLAAPALQTLNAEQGCLSEKVPAHLPQYDLSREQRTALRAALTPVDSPVTHSSEQKIEATLTAFNCYACHERHQKGGREISRNDLFVAKIPEMGDEGRLPPTLNGVGDKLQETWLKQVLHNGARDRDYMLARMPKFQHGAVDQLASLLIEADQQTTELPANATLQTLKQEPIHRIEATGQELISGKALACIKCHTFANYPATGIQAISLTTMHKRLRADWFQRYLTDPQKYRPGTRMPNSFPNGVSAARDILDGDPQAQILAMWLYLQQGDKAGIPAGLLPDPIELVAVEQPIIYRNFIEGLSPRGIGVGYPEKANIGWDAQDLCLKQIWHGSFIDASKHWRGRGPGFQRPLGVHLMELEHGIPWAIATEGNSDWPTSNAQERGFRFLGYRLDEAGRPIFRLSHPTVTIEEEILPLAKTDTEADLKRVFHLEPQQPGTRLTFRAAQGKELELIDDGRTILLNGSIRIQLQDSVHSAEAPQPLKFRMQEQRGLKSALYDLELTEPRQLEQVIRW